MLIADKHSGYARDGIRRVFFDGGSSPPPPDYTPVAQSSVESARIGAELGEKQLAEAQRQYNENMAVARPVVDAQLDIMRQTAEQGADYAEYAKTFRPLEQQLIAEAAAGTEGDNAALREQIRQQGVADALELRQRTEGFEQGQAADIALATGGNQAIYNKFKGDIDADVGTAVADARTGQTQALNTAMRQALRYGVTVPASATALTNQNAAQLAAAANNTRTGATKAMRDVIAGGVGLKQGAFLTGQAALTDSMNRGTQALTADRNMQIQDKSLDFARKLDVTGMARGLPGASSGAYSVATNAGNSAVGNQMAPGSALQGAMGQSANTTMQGRQLAQQGALGVLNAQTSYANSVANSGTDWGGILGGVGGIAAAFAPSDERLKDNIVSVGVDPATGLELFEFNYLAWPLRRFRGLIAQRVQRTHPHAVITAPNGFLAVNYAALGITMQEIHP